MRQATAYLEPGETGYVAIIPYAFGNGFDDAEAIIELRDGKARFISEAPAAFVSYALDIFKKIEGSPE